MNDVTTLLPMVSVERFAIGMRRIAAGALRMHQQGNFLVSKKADGSALSEIDEKNQKLLKRLIVRCFGSDLVMIGEEDPEDMVYPEHRVYAYIDPIDGTSPLAAGFKYGWSLLTGFVIDGRPVLGFMASPLFDFVLFGGEAVGSVFILDKKGIRNFIPQPVMRENKLWSMDMATSVAQDIFQVEFHRRLIANREIGGYPCNVPSGQSGIDLLSGMTKFWVSGNAKPWDLCSIHSIALMQGMVVRHIDGTEIDWSKSARHKLPPFVLADSEQSYLAVKGIHDATLAIWNIPERRAAIEAAWRD